MLGTEYDKKNFAFTLPQGFNQIRGIGILSSATIQQTQLFMQHNIAEDVKGMIFVNTMNDKRD